MILKMLRKIIVLRDFYGEKLHVNTFVPVLLG
jgi:hypothetical protein